MTRNAIVLTTLLILSSLISTLAQQQEVCVISSVAGPAGLSETAAEKLKEVELARIDISNETEGSLDSKTFKIPGSGLYAYIEIFFDDDMKFYDSLYPALTVWTLITTHESHAKKNVIGMARSQVAFDESFKQQDVTVRAKWKRRVVAVNVRCRGKKPKDE